MRTCTCITLITYVIRIQHPLLLTLKQTALTRIIRDVHFYSLVVEHSGHCGKGKMIYFARNAHAYTHTYIHTHTTYHLPSPSL